MKKRTSNKINQATDTVAEHVSTKANAKLNVNQPAAKMKEIHTAATHLQSTTIKELINHGRDW